MKNIKLEWYVLNHDFNADKIKNQNIFLMSDVDELKKARKNGKFTNKNELKEFLKRRFMNNYWCKAECEILVGGLFSKSEKFEKIDMYRQIEMNLDQITDYVINQLGFRFDNKKKKKEKEE